MAFTVAGMQEATQGNVCFVLAHAVKIYARVNLYPA